MAADTLTYWRFLKEKLRLLREIVFWRKALAGQINVKEDARQQTPEHTQGEQHSAQSTNGGSITPDAGFPELQEALKKQTQRERHQPPKNKQREQHPAQPTSSGSIKPDEEFLKLIKLWDARLAKNARVKYVDGKK